MKAEEAKALSEENSITVGQIIGLIEAAAKNGIRQISMRDYIGISQCSYLLNLGYSIRDYKDPFNGMKSTIVEW